MPKFMLEARVTFSSLLEVDGDDVSDEIPEEYLAALDNT